MLVFKLFETGQYSCKIVKWDDVRVWKHAMDVSIPCTESEHEESGTQIHPQTGMAPWTSVRSGPWAFSIHSLSKKRKQIWANPCVCNVSLVNDPRWLNQKGKKRLPFRFSKSLASYVDTVLYKNLHIINYQGIT